MAKLVGGRGRERGERDRYRQRGREWKTCTFKCRCLMSTLFIYNALLNATHKSLDSDTHLKHSKKETARRREKEREREGEVEHAESGSRLKLISYETL